MLFSLRHGMQKTNIPYRVVVLPPLNKNPLLISQLNHIPQYLRQSNMTCYDSMDIVLSSSMKTHLKGDKILPVIDAQICDITTQMALATGHAMNQCLTSSPTTVTNNKNICHLKYVFVSKPLPTATHRPSHAKETHFGMKWKMILHLASKTRCHNLHVK